MNINEIKDLLNVIDKTNLEYIKLETNDLKLEVSKTTTNTKKTLSNLEDCINETIITESYEETQTNDNLVLVEAPLMGTYYASPSPTDSNFVKVGDIVNQGDTLCILEAMKLMNEITSDLSGEIIEILVKNEELVEYSQPLFKIRPL
ncbi:MAG: acetyl-CoA carboxylase biotin carboxyl carrier protein [Romboutsia sp.]